MKKYLLYKSAILFFILMITLIAPAFAEYVDVTVADPTDIYINREPFDTTGYKYPIIKYNEMHYLPLSQGYMKELGLSDWDYELKIFISERGYPPVGDYILGEKLEPGKKLKAKLSDKELYLNKKHFLEYNFPALEYGGVEYVPLTMSFLMAFEDVGFADVVNREVSTLHLYTKELLNEQSSDDNPTVYNHSDELMKGINKAKVNKKVNLLQADVDLMEHITIENPTNEDLVTINQMKSIQSMTVAYLDNIDISTLPNLTNIKGLSVFYSSVDVVNLIKKCPNLEYLRLVDSPIVYEELPKSDKLTELVIKGFEGDNISYLEKYSQLKRLTVVGGSIRNIEILNYFKNLERLTIEDNEIKDITPLSSLDKLEHLYLGGNLIKDISILSNLKNLKEIDFHENQLSSIDVLESLEKLEVVNLNHANINSLAPLSSSKNLYKLSATNIYLNDLDWIAEAKHLRYLNLYNCHVEDLMPLSKLIHLEKLYLALNSFYDTSPLRGLSNLRVLDIRGNSLTDVSVISVLHKLEEIYVDFNELTSIPSIKNLDHLETFTARDNKLNDINHLATQKNIKKMDFQNNNITDLLPLKNMKHVNLEMFKGNPIEDYGVLNFLPYEDVQKISLLNYKSKDDGFVFVTLKNEDSDKYNDYYDRVQLGLSKLRTENTQTEFGIIDKTDTDENIATKYFMGDVDLIFSTGQVFDKTLENLVMRNAYQKFALVDSPINGSNVASIQFKEEEGHFLMGNIAAMYSKTGNVACLIGTLSNDEPYYGYAFKAGAKMINNEVQDHYGEINSSYGVTLKEEFEYFHEEGVDVVFITDDYLLEESIPLAEEYDMWIIASGKGLMEIESDRIVASMVLDIEGAVYDISQDVMNNEFIGGKKLYNLANNGVQYIDFAGKLGENQIKILEKNRQDIIDGNILVPLSYEDLELFRKKHL